MKRTSLVGALFILGLVTVTPLSLAADSYNWSGPYVGANFGGVFGRGETHTDVKGPGLGSCCGGYFLPLDYIYSDEW